LTGATEWKIATLHYVSLAMTVGVV
jgi:hypothetical protein